MKKLRTGQMLDELGMNDVAMNQSGYKVGYDHKGNLVMWMKDEEKPDVTDGNLFMLYYPWVKNDLWVIEYDLVDFEEAQRTHAQEKKTVVYLSGSGREYRFVHGEYGHFKQLAEDGIALDEITKGKWRIEN